MRLNSGRDPLSERSRRGERLRFVIPFPNGAVEQEGLDILNLGSRVDFGATRI